jgi:hypothetical protein
MAKFPQHFSLHISNIYGQIRHYSITEGCQVCVTATEMVCRSIVSASHSVLDITRMYDIMGSRDGVVVGIERINLVFDLVR